MKNDLTELVFILDLSGSMSGLERDTIGRDSYETEGGSRTAKHVGKINLEMGNDVFLTGIVMKYLINNEVSVLNIRH